MAGTNINNITKLINNNRRSAELHSMTTLNNLGGGPTSLRNSRFTSPSDQSHKMELYNQQRWDRFIFGFSTWGSRKKVGK